MLAFNHQAACRNCMRTTGIEYRYRLNSTNQEKYQNKSEYELMLLLEKWRAEDGYRCEFCGSDNVEVSEIDVDGHKLYNLTSLRDKSDADGSYVLYLKSDKGPENDDLKLWQYPTLTWPFLSEAFYQIKGVFARRADSTFKSHPRGFFFICVSVKPASTPLESTFTIQKLSYGGVCKQEVLSGIEALEEKEG